MSRARALVKAAALAAAALAAAACASIDPSATDAIACPAPDDFRSVSAVLERRCGTLDCHGSAARPLRIYGQYGLRRPEPQGSPDVHDFSQYFPGGLEPTTQAELDDNLRSICGLEPEIVTRVVAHASEPDALTIVRKPRLEEKHKGGAVWFKGSEGDRCLTSWLDGSIASQGVGSCEDELSRYQ